MKQNSSKYTPLSVAMLGATGAVGGQTLQTLLELPDIQRITLFGRRSIPELPAERVVQHKIDIFDPETYGASLSGHEYAICTLGVGQPSKMSREEFIKIDKLAVIDFARACKKAGVRHFELLSSVGIHSKSSSFYLRTKGELVEELVALKFERLSIFKPSMILTPNNRYGFGQAVTLAVWPLLKPLFIGGMRQYRGIRVEELGKAFAQNILTDSTGTEYLSWDHFRALNGKS